MQSKLAPWFMILVLFVLLILQRECMRNQRICTETQNIEVRIDTIFETKPIQIVQTHFEPKYIFQRDSIFIHDTAFVLVDYSTTKVYCDTLTDDTTFFAVITDTLFQNRLEGRNFYFENRRPTHIIQPIPKPKPQLFLALNFEGNQLSQELGASGYLITRKGHFYGYGYKPFSNRHEVSFGWRVKKLKLRLPSN